MAGVGCHPGGPDGRLLSAGINCLVHARPARHGRGREQGAARHEFQPTAERVRVSGLCRRASPSVADRARRDGHLLARRGGLCPDRAQVIHGQRDRFRVADWRRPEFCGPVEQRQVQQFAGQPEHRGGAGHVGYRGRSGAACCTARSRRTSWPSRSRVAVPPTRRHGDQRATRPPPPEPAACANAFANAYLQNRSSSAAAAIRQQIEPLKASRLPAEDGRPEHQDRRPAIELPERGSAQPTRHVRGSSGQSLTRGGRAADRLAAPTAGPSSPGPPPGKPSRPKKSTGAAGRASRSAGPRLDRGVHVGSAG